MDASSLLDRIARLHKARALTRGSAYLARLLVERASDQWTLYLTRAEACEVCGVTNWGSARRSLSKLEDAGLIGLHTNNCAYIRFLEPDADADDRAESARSRADSARQEPDDLTPRAETARQRAESARQRAESARQRAGLDDPRKDQDQDQLQEGRIIPSYPAFPDPSGGAGGAETAPKVRDSAQKRRGAGPPAIPTDEQTRSVLLLTDPQVGLYPKLATDAAARYGFRAIAAQVFRFLRDRAAGTVRSPGCIPQRLARPDLFPAEMEIDDFETDLWLDHAGEADLEWGRGAVRRKYIPDDFADIILG